VPAKVDLFEINETFASVAIHPMRDLDIGSVVVNGGAIAMGHPPASSTSTYQPEKSAQLRPVM
jgi:acetyl-CoA acetyltransferase